MWILWNSFFTLVVGISFGLLVDIALYERDIRAGRITVGWDADIFASECVDFLCGLLLMPTTLLGILYRAMLATAQLPRALPLVQMPDSLKSEHDWLALRAFVVGETPRQAKLELDYVRRYKRWHRSRAQ